MKLQLKTTEGKAILDDDWGTISINGDGGSVRGAVATVDTAGAIDKRITATRMLLTGPLALAWRKKKDERELYLLVEGDTYSLVAKIDSNQGLEARKFAAAINSASKKLGSAEPSNIAPGEVPSWVGKTADVVIREIAVLKLGTPKMVDNRGKPAMVAFQRQDQQSAMPPTQPRHCDLPSSKSHLLDGSGERNRCIRIP